MLSPVAVRALPACASAPTPLRAAAPRAASRLLSGRPALPGAGRSGALPGWAPPASQSLAGRVAGVRLRARAAPFHTGAIALGAADRPALADDAEDAPHNRVAAEDYRAQLAREEEAGLFEESDGEDERVEVDANAGPDDTLAVRAARRAGLELPPRLRLRAAPRRAATHAATRAPPAAAVQVQPDGRDGQGAGGARRGGAVSHSGGNLQASVGGARPHRTRSDRHRQDAGLLAAHHREAHPGAPSPCDAAALFARAG
jgi:hypothetical protein